MMLRRTHVGVAQLQNSVFANSHSQKVDFNMADELMKDSKWSA